MDRPKSVVRVIRGVAQTVHVSCRFGGQVLQCTEFATSEYSTTSQCLSALLGPARESEVYPRRPQMEKKRPAHRYSHTLFPSFFWVAKTQLNPSHRTKWVVEIHRV